ncbi:MAG: NADH-quinone oxidoreductase subunit A [Bacteroidaceae bacterium]|nr:NADH-quinone oxidoreductase subunit A [Bacteroidaceae bacterium]MBR3916485.1 NADH-quinone oxidoreductase subunit A [Bacteroidaceae bacterium]
MDLVLLFTMIIASIAFVGIVMILTRWISPRTFNRQKGETYECGIPTQGETWIHFKAGYYLFAILFLMFDIEAVFLFPWATIVQELGMKALVGVLFFLFFLILGLAYAWRKKALEWK